MSVSSLFNSGFAFLVRTSHKWSFALLSTANQETDNSNVCYTSNVNFDNLIQMVSTKFLHCKFSIFFCIINKYLLDSYFETMKISYISYFCPLILAFTDTTISTMLSPYIDFYFCHYFQFIIQDSTLRESAPSLSTYGSCISPIELTDFQIFSWFYELPPL